MLAFFYVINLAAFLKVKNCVISLSLITF